MHDADARILGHDEENPPELKAPLPPNYILQHNEAAMLLDQVSSLRDTYTQDPASCACSRNMLQPSEAIQIII